MIIRLISLARAVSEEPMAKRRAMSWVISFACCIHVAGGGGVGSWGMCCCPLGVWVMDSASCKACAAESKRVETDAWHAWWSLSEGAESPRSRLGERNVPSVFVQD